MGSFALKTISIAIVIALIVGAGAGYIVGNSPVSSLMEEKDWLEAEYDSLYLALQSLEVKLEEAEFNIIGLNRTILVFSERYADMIFIDMENQELIQQVIDLEAEMSILAEDYQYVEDKYEEIQLSYLELEDKIQDLQELNQSYIKLQETIDLFSVSNNSRKINFSINIKDSCEVHDEWKFDIGYGIIMKIRMWVQVSPYGSQIIIGHTWIRGDTQGNLGGGSRTYAQLPDLLEGYAYCEIYDKGNFVQADIGVIPLQPSWEGMDRGATFPKVIE